MDIEDELALLAKNTPAIKPFLQKFSEYLKSGVEVIDAQWDTCEDFPSVQKLAGEKKSLLQEINFLELLIHPPKEEEGDTESA